MTRRVPPCGSLAVGDNGGICSRQFIFVFLLAAWWLSCVVALDLCAADEFAPIGVGEAQAQLREMEQVMETRFRNMAGRDALEAANGAIGNFNASSQAKGRAFEERRAKLNDELRAIRRQEEEVKGLDAGLKINAPRRGDQAALDAYNARVRQRNQLVERLDTRNKVYKSAVEAYNAAIQKFNGESESQRGKLDGVAKVAVSRVNEQQRWLMNRKDVEFYRRVNELNARLLGSIGGAATGKLSECVKAAAALRAELASWRRGRSSRGPMGWLSWKR